MKKNKIFLSLCLIGFLIFLLDISYSIFALYNFISINNGTKLLAENYLNFTKLIVVFNSILLAAAVLYPIAKILFNYIEYNRISKKKDNNN